MCDLLLGKLSHNESSQASGCITLIGIVLDDETLPRHTTQNAAKQEEATLCRRKTHLMHGRAVVLLMKLSIVRVNCMRHIWNEKNRRGI